jgi:hypothetical protein
MSRKLSGLALFGIAIAIAAVAGTFYLLDADEGSGTGSDPGVLVDFTRSGGFAGITQQLIVYTDGRATLTTGQGATDTETVETVLPPDEFEELRRTLPQIAEALDDAFDAPPDDGAMCADCFQYDLIYDGAGYHFSDVARMRKVTELLQILDEAICETGTERGCA